MSALTGNRPAFVGRLFALFLVLGVFQPAGAFASGSGSIRIISTNDTHSYLRPVYHRYQDEMRPWGTQSSEGDYAKKSQYEGRVGGMAHVATVIKQLRAEKPGKTLLVDSGDTWHGSGLSVVDRGASMVKIMNEIGYDAMAPGNWEYFYPKEHLLSLIDQAKFPVVAFNLVDKEWGEPVLKQYTIKKVGGLTVAIIGMTYPWTALTSSVVGAAKWWKFGIRENEAVELIERIRKKENADLIVVISHGGYGYDQKFARQVDGIDVLVSGHTHNAVFDPIVWNDTIIYESGSHGEYVSSLDIEVKNKKVVSYDYRLVKVRADQVPADPNVKKLVDEAYRPHDKKLGEVIGQAEGVFFRRDYFQSTLGNLITDALRSRLGADVSFFPAWRYGATLMPGKITVEDVYNIDPTGAHVVTYNMSGKQIKLLLENILDAVVTPDAYSRVGGDMIRFSGLNIVYDLDNERGKRVVSITLANGKPFEPKKVYSIASVNTRFQNNPLFGATNVVDTGKVFADELVAYIRAKSRIKAALDGRIRSRRGAAAGS